VQKTNKNRARSTSPAPCFSLETSGFLIIQLALLSSAQDRVANSKANGMSASKIDLGDIRPVSVAFTTDDLVVSLADGRKVATPLAWYPRLRNADDASREHFELMPLGVHWPELDEDLSIAGMLQGRKAV
jgi:Protein of unknown function (DUF2442)